MIYIKTGDELLFSGLFGNLSLFYVRKNIIHSKSHEFIDFEFTSALSLRDDYVVNKIFSEGNVFSKDYRRGDTIRYKDDDDYIYTSINME